MRIIFSKRKYLVSSIIAVVLFILIFGSYNLLQNNRDAIEKQDRYLTWYGIDVVFSPQEGTLHCKQRVYYTKQRRTSHNLYHILS